MSGVFTYRINRFLDASTGYGNITPARWFWDFISFVNSHLGLAVIEVGNSGGSLGTSIPASWLAWDATTDPDALSPAMDANSWVVFEAENADALLNGGGTMPWQAKIQYADSTSYVDPSGTDYGRNGITNGVVIRASVMGGWVGSPTFDFQPGTGEAISNDRLAWSGQNTDYWFDIVGDDDTLFWRSAGVSDLGTSNPYATSKGGYLGMIQARSPAINYPFFFMAGVCGTTVGALEYALNSKYTNNANYQWRHWGESGASNRWPGYSVGWDKGLVETHRIETYQFSAIENMRTYHYTGEDILPAIRLAQWESPYFAIIGELRLLVVVGSDKGEGQLHGDDSEWLQFCQDPASYYGGVSMRWPPGGVTPAW